MKNFEFSFAIGNYVSQKKFVGKKKHWRLAYNSNCDKVKKAKGFLKLNSKTLQHHKFARFQF